MTYRLLSFSSVKSDLAAIARTDQLKVREAIRSLASQPHPAGSAKLSGYSDIYRIRVGNYRVVYRIRNRELEVIVVAVGERGGIYRLLKRRLKK